MSLTDCRKSMCGMISLVQFRIGAPLLFGDLHRVADLNQRTLTDSRTRPPRAIPRRPPLDNLRPERKRSALSGLRWVNRAAIAHQKRTLLIARFAQAALVA